MGRREQREQIFKLVFQLEFNDKSEMPEQMKLYLEQEGQSFTAVEEKTGISKSTLVREKRNRKAKMMQEQG